MKYLFLIILFCFSLNSKAQTIENFTGSDTIINTGTVNVDLSVRQSYNSAVFQVINTKVSGTVAGNTLFQASVDGVNYVTLDTLANTNVAINTKIITETPCKYPFYRFTYTGTGTMSAIMTAKAHFKK